MSADSSFRRSESLSKIPRSSSGSIIRPKLDARDSVLTRTNSLNPVLRINRSASASIATSSATFHAQRSRTNSEVSAGSARSVGSKKKPNYHQEERSRRTSSESLRHCLERAPSPAPSAASSTTSKKSSPSSFVRRSSSSHSSLNSSPSSLRTPDRAGLHVRNTSTASAPAVTNTVSFPSNYSPTHSRASSTSAPSFDILKSSLRDALANYQVSDEGSSSNAPPHVRSRPERRSVSFMLDEAQAISEAAKAESSQSNTATSTNSSSPSTAIASRTSTSSSTSQTYPVTDWQPISPDNDGSAPHMPILPLQLARYIIGLSEKDTSLADTSEVSSERDSTDNGSASPVATNASHSTHEVLYRDSNTVVKVMETFIGLWLAVIWLSIGRIVGSDRSR